MCYFSKQTKDAQTLEKRFKAKFAEENKFSPSIYYNGFTYPKTPVITNSNSELIQLYSWGLLPSWAKADFKRKDTLNARIETLTERSSYKNSINKRCLVLVDGFYEWFWFDDKGKKKQKYLITVPNDEPFAFAGIYNECVDKSTGEIMNTYSIITTEANKLMSEIHNHGLHMPVILTPETEKLWFTENNYMEFAHPEVELVATKI